MWDRTVRLGDICSFNLKSYTPKMNWDFVNYLDTGNITNGEIQAIQQIDLRTEKLPSRAKRCVKYNSIVYSTVRPNQRHFGIMKNIPDNFLVSTGFAVLDIDEKQADADFIYYYLMQEDIINGLEALAEQNTSTYPSIKPSDIADVVIHLPNLSVQHQIAAILTALDAKKAINQKINDNLTQQVKLISDKWLKKYISLYNNHSVDVEMIPLSQIANFYSGYSYKSKELQKSDIAMLTIKNFDRKGGFKMEGYKEIIPLKKLKNTQFAKPFDIFVAHTDLTQNAEVIGNAELLMGPMKHKSIIFSMDLVKVTPKDNRISKFLLAAILQNHRFKEHCFGYINGTTVLHLSKKALSDYQIILPKNLSDVVPLNSVIESMYRQISTNLAENIYLENIRNHLLLKIMSKGFV